MVSRVILILVAAVSLNVSALIFPLQPDENGAYDFNYNVLTSYSSLWSSNHHAMYRIGGANGVAVAPRWILTAWHVAREMNEEWFVNDDNQRYYFRQKIDLGSTNGYDLALVRVDKPLPYYSKIQSQPGGADDILTMYGYSAAPIEPILDQNGVAKGWNFGPVTNHQALRWGRGRRLASPASTIQWDFTNTDPKLGLNCSMGATNDSGGGIFVEDELVGIMTGVVVEGRRNLPDELWTKDCDLNRAMLFDPSGFYKCTSQFPPITRTYGAGVYDSLSNIFSQISPPVRINAGGPEIVAGENTWLTGTNCTGCSAYLDASSLPIDTSSVTGAPPAELYKSVAYLASQSQEKMTFVFDELIKYEKYKVRLHFASIFPADAPGVCNELITVDGSSKVFDPYTGPRKAISLTLDDVSPDENSSISVTLAPQNPGGNAAICGIEILMVPRTPLPPVETKTDLVASYPKRPEAVTNIVFGNGRFVATGKSILFSTDNGGIWQTANPPLGYPPSGPSGSGWNPTAITFGADQFVAVRQAYIPYERPSIITSRNGRDWNIAFEGGNLKSVAYGNGLFVAVGPTGPPPIKGPVIVTSRDAQTWQVLTNLTTNSLSAVTFGNGRFLVGEEFNWVFLTSTDGTNWTRYPAKLPPVDPPCSDCFGPLLGLTFGNNSFIGYGAVLAKAWYPPRTIFSEGSYLEYGPLPDPQLFLTSIDGENWLQIPTTLKPDAGSLLSLNNHFLYLPGRSASADFVDWQSFNLPLYPGENPTNITITGGAFGNSTYVIAGNAGRWFRGTNLSSLTRVDSSPTTDSRPRIAANGRTLVILNRYSGLPTPMLVSTNSGATFVPVDLPPDSTGLRAILRSENEFVAVGEQGRILRSADGLLWSKSSTDTVGDLYDVAFGGGMWVATGSNGVLVVSTDARTFTTVNSGTTSSLNGVTFGSAGFVVVGSPGIILKSIDGHNWSQQAVQHRDLFGVAFGNGRFVAVGDTGYAMISTNGVDWDTARPTGSTLREIAYANGLFLTINNSIGTAYTSIDGVSWSELTLPIGSSSVCSSDDTLWFTGENSNFGLNIPFKFVGKLRLRTPHIPLTASLHSSGGITLRAEVDTAGKYTLLTCEDLTNPAWKVLSTLPARDATGIINSTYANPQGRVRFFRVRLE